MATESRTFRTVGIALPLFAISFLAACAPQSVRQLPVFTSWEERSQILGDIQDWEFRGRLGVRTADDGFNGKVQWQQQASDYNAQISGPVGIGTLQISGSQDLVRLEDQDGQLTVLTSPEADLEALYGWKLPVNSLRFWALGIPDPKSLATTLVVDERGLLTVLVQNGWRIEYPDYRSFAGQPMPRRLVATAGDARVVLVFDNWVFK